MTLESDSRAREAYARLVRTARSVGGIASVQALLQWDRTSHPSDSAAATRAAQADVLARLRADLLRDPVTRQHLALVRSHHDAFTRSEWRNVDLFENELLAEAAVDAELQAALAAAEVQCVNTWRHARDTRDFAQVRDALQHMLTLQRALAQSLADAYGCSPYDALLRRHDRDTSISLLDPIFAELAHELPQLITAIERQNTAASSARIEIDVDRQHSIVRQVIADTGVFADDGILTETVHPHAMGHVPGDMRIGTHYADPDPNIAVLGALHELGHACYEFGLPREALFEPVQRSLGFGFHESQSLLFESCAARSRPYLAYLTAVLQQHGGLPGAPDDLDRMVAQTRRVQRSAIRVSADEVTYPLHLIIRYQLEQRLISGELDAADLPAAWNRLYGEILGYHPRHDGEGCLQDIHWFIGLFGAFPGYTLGAIRAAQLFSAARAARPDLDAALRIGRLTPLVEWLSHHVYRHASRLPTEALMTQATGARTNARVFVDYLRNRYLANAD